MAKRPGNRQSFSQTARNRSGNAPLPPPVADVDDPDDPGAATAPPASSPSEPEFKTIAIKVDPKTGEWLADRARADTIAGLRKAFDSDAARAALGAASPDATATNAALMAAMVGGAFTAIGKVAAGMAMSRGVSEAAALHLLVDAEDMKLLAPATLAVLAKYNLLGGKYAEELALLGAVVTVGASKYDAMQRADDLVKARTTAAAS